MSEPNFTTIHQSVNCESSQRLSLQGLSRAGTVNQRQRQAHPSGFEPSALGSADAQVKNAKSHSASELQAFPEIAIAFRKQDTCNSSHSITVNDTLATSKIGERDLGLNRADTNLASIVKAWPTLPPHVQETIDLLVRVSGSLPKQPDLASKPNV